MENIEKLVVDGMLWLGVSGVVLLVAAALRNALNSDTYDNTGLLEYSKNREKQDKSLCFYD